MLFDIHAVFLALGQPHGILIKEVFELIIFTLITYMLASEYTRDPRKGLKYMILGFGIFAIEKAAISLVLLSTIYGNLAPSFYQTNLQILINTAETFAIVLLGTAFLFPMLKKIKRDMLFESIFLGIAFVIAQIIFIKTTDYQIVASNASIFFNAVKLCFILYVILSLSIKTQVKYRYRYSTIIAFLLFMIAPLFRFINLAFYANNNARLMVASHPFPIIAVIFFARIIYLRLVDKAYLRKKLEKTEKKYEHEKELGELKDKFVSIVSHELRTPLTSINLYTSLLRDGKFGKISPKQKKAVSIIKQESDRLANLINDILDLSKLEAKGMKLKITEFDLSEYLKDNPYFMLAKKKKIKIINKIPKNFIIKVDSEKFKQVLINLISNALKYTDKGSITLTAKKLPNKYQIDISDTGRGIPKQELDRIFDKFYQVENYMQRSNGGFGLGLAIVNEIVKMHNGEIKVKSEVGKGTVFSIFIPNNL